MEDSEKYMSEPEDQDNSPAGDSESEIVSMKNELEQVQGYFSRFYENLPAALMTLSRGGIILDINSQAAEILGCEKEKAVGLHLIDFIAPTLRDECWHFISRIFASDSKAHHSVKLRLKTHDGDVMSVIKLMGSAFLQSEELYEQCCIVLEDISRSEENQSYLKERQMLLSMLNTVSETSDAVEIVLDACTTHNYIDCAAIFVRDDVKGELVFSKSSGLSQFFINQLLSDKGAAILEMIPPSSPEPVHVTRSIIERRNIFRLHLEEGIRSFTVLPLIHNSQLEACIYAASKTADSLPDSAKTALASICAETAIVLARLRAETAHRKSEEHLLGLLNNAVSPIFVKDTSKHFTIVNKAFLKYMRKTEQEMLGCTPRELFPTNIADTLCEKDDSVLESGETVEFEAKLETEDGIRHFLMTKFPLYDEGGLPCAVCTIATDISGIVKANEEMRIAKEEADKANKLKSLFVANLSHEIRTPMNAIMGFTDIVLGTELNAEQRKCLTMVKNRASDLLVIISDILEISRIEAGIVHIAPVPANLTEIVTETVRTFVQPAAMKNIAVRMKASDDIPPIVICSPVRIRQILNNIIGNALKFTERGSIFVTLSKYKHAAESQETETFLFTVSDTGIGIPQHMQSNVFEPFVQGNPGSTRSYGGTGLGLTICKKLVEAMNGKIWIESNENRGTCFYFTLELQLPY